MDIRRLFFRIWFSINLFVIKRQYCICVYDATHANSEGKFEKSKKSEDGRNYH